MSITVAEPGLDPPIGGVVVASVGPALSSEERGILRRIASGETLWSHVVPAVLFQIGLLSHLIGFAQRLLRGPGDLAPLNFGVWAVEQGLTNLFWGMIVVLFIIRRPVVGKRSSPLGAVVAIAGTFGANVPVGAGVVDNVVVLAASTVLILVGTFWTVWSLAYLGRCFGIMPEARGLVTSGPYRLVRHPVYLGELTAIFGMSLATASPAIFAVYFAVCGLCYWRTRLEERALATVFPEYAAYARRTRRILPGIL